MNSQRLILSLLSMLLIGCAHVAQPPATVAATQPELYDWPDDVPEAPYDPHAIPGTQSATALTAALEKRWPLDRIRAFCVPQNRAGNGQNLTWSWPTEAWAGRLYANQATGFDRIFWYATVKHGKLEAYSLNVQRGADFWCLEIGGATSATQPADAIQEEPSTESK